MTTLEQLTGKAHTSYSAFTTYLDCGEKFRLQRIVGISEDPAYYLAGGSAVHEGTETFDKEWSVQGTDFTTSVQMGVEKFHNSFEMALLERPNATWRAGGRKSAANPNGEDAAWWKVDGERQVRAYADWRFGNQNTWGLWRTEAGVTAIELGVDPVFTGDVQLKGYIDRVFEVKPGGDLVVVDLKSGSREPSSPLQLAVYAVAMEKQYGVRPKYGAYFMTRKASMGQAFDLTPYTEQMLSYQFRGFRKAVESKIFVPHVTMMCSSCGVRDACYAVDPTLDPPDLDFDADLNETSTQETE